MLRALAVALAALVLAPAAQAAPTSPPPPEHRADPSLTTYVERLGPFKIGSYETLQKAAKATPPAVGGAIVAMDARLVDATGAVIPQQITMLHHLVFTNGGPDDRRGDPACPLKTTRERFWGTSEGGRYAHRFTEPGTYLLQCSLHSAYMSQVVTVTRERPRPRDEDLPRH
jgi:hypothetical protein